MCLPDPGCHPQHFKIMKPGALDASLFHVSSSLSPCSGFSVALEAVLALYMRLALNSQKSTCLCLLSAGIKGMCHQCPAAL
ncbi:Fcor [Phodopus roborovskii]|uniref:Fcor protein n=1 Tax=Phodopus roborovskii TaxID=109678 RepID=A0AAV0A2E3_PHORO|nr:Fcor [Phodopus roborovskii]